MIPLLLALLAIPFLSRLLIFFGELRHKPFWAPGYLFGIVQDLFIAALLFLFLTLSDTLYFFFSFLVAVALVYHLVDALLLLTANFRMQFSFYRYLFEFGDFKSSAEAFGIRPMAFGVVFSFFCLLLFFFWSKDVFLQVDTAYLFPLIVVSALLSSLSCLGSVKK